MLADKDQNTPSQPPSGTTEERAAKRMRCVVDPLIVTDIPDAPCCRFNDWFAAESPEVRLANSKVTGPRNSHSVVSLQPGQIVSSPVDTTRSTLPTSVPSAGRGRSSALPVDNGPPPKVASPPRPIKVEATDEILPPAATSSHPSRPTRSYVLTRRPPLLHMQSPTKTSQINKLSRDLWHTRKDISIAQERESRLQKELDKLTDSRVSKLEVKESQPERSESLTDYITLLSRILTWSTRSSRGHGTSAAGGAVETSVGARKTSSR